MASITSGSGNKYCARQLIDDGFIGKPMMGGLRCTSWGLYHEQLSYTGSVRFLRRQGQARCLILGAPEGWLLIF